MSNGTKTYTFKPALLKRKQAYFIGEDRIELANKDGSDTVVRFDSITSLRYADTSAREYKFRRLDISYGDGDGEMMRINITTGLASTARNDKDLESFYQLIESIAKKLNRARPSLTVTIGETSKINWIYFSIGALTFLSAGGILLGALLGGVSNQKLMNALLPIIAMAGFGAYICFMASPWTKRPDINMSKFKLLMEALLSN